MSEEGLPSYVTLAMNNAAGLPTPAEAAATRQHTIDARVASEQF